MNIIYEFDAGFIELVSSRQQNKDTIHYGMTTCALYRVTLDYLKSTYNVDTAYLDTKFDEANGQCQEDIIQSIISLLKTSQMKGINPWLYSATVKIIASANTKTDLKEMFKEASHFDSESFIGGSKLIMKRYQSTLDAILKSDNYDQRRKTFGEMLHTIQDFYSHTNYIELAYDSPSDVLAERIFGANEFASADMRTYISCDGQQCQINTNIDQSVLKTKLLTSGYFILLGFNFLKKFKPKGKCSHGGSFDSTEDDEPKSGINKDKLNSIHGHLHYQAASIAYKATVNILRQLQQEIAKDLSINIVNQYGQSEFAPHNYILISFNNTNATTIINTRKPNDLIIAIQKLNSCENYTSALDGMYYSSLIEGLIQSEYSSVMYTFSDTSASDSYLKYPARSLLRNKQVVIYSFLGQQMERLLLLSKLDFIDQLDQNYDGSDLPSISGGLTYPITINDKSAILEFIIRRLE
ncbi:unnamed protein product [Rotaria sp. Silwood2]|nr:unnamed protein product [Rotaria sp. Silwood2]CAF4323739.1 unnamed protein product [Rotaria sp. Silwood2]